MMMKVRLFMIVFKNYSRLGAGMHTANHPEGDTPSDQAGGWWTRLYRSRIKCSGERWSPSFWKGWTGPPVGDRTVTSVQPAIELVAGRMGKQGPCCEANDPTRGKCIYLKLQGSWILYTHFFTACGGLPCSVILPKAGGRLCWYHTIKLDCSCVSAVHLHLLIF